jgi:glyoxylase-like metal-dependent hydrolase (beta-lactamase superfamily II)
MGKMIKKLVVGLLQTNCYLFYKEEGGESFIIDPGDDADYVMNIIRDLDLKPKAILVTHGHSDHVGAVEELKLAYKIPVYINLKEGKTIDVDGLKLEVLRTSGHTEDSVCFYCKEEGLIFVGDLVFAGGGVGRTDLAGGDWEKLKNSIKKIAKLPEKTIIYPGHGLETSVKEMNEEIIY